METIRTKYIGNLRTEATHVNSGQQIITDAPVDNQGLGEAFSPTDLMCSSLASCMLTIMGISARTHGFSIEGTTVTITKHMGSNPRRVIAIDVELKLPSDYSEKERKLIETSARTCPVALSIHPEIAQNLTFLYG